VSIFEVPTPALLQNALLGHHKVSFSWIIIRSTESKKKSGWSRFNRFMVPRRGLL